MTSISQEGRNILLKVEMHLGRRWAEELAMSAGPSTADFPVRERWLAEAAVTCDAWGLIHKLRGGCPACVPGKKRDCAVPSGKKAQGPAA
jgi:hypothetical protein